MFSPLFLLLSLISGTTALSTVEYANIKSAVSDFLTTESVNDVVAGDLAAAWIRSIFHDAGTFQTLDENGLDFIANHGAHGCLLIPCEKNTDECVTALDGTCDASCVEGTDCTDCGNCEPCHRVAAENKGMEEALVLQDNLYITLGLSDGTGSLGLQLGRADFFYLCGNVAVEFLTPDLTFIIGFRTGRTDCPSSPLPVFPNALPAASGTKAEVNRVFNRLGMTEAQAMVLMGAHTVGRCELVNSGFDRKWVQNTDVFDNDYFNTLDGIPWSREINDDGNPQWLSSLDAEVMLLNTDLALGWDIEDGICTIKGCEVRFPVIDQIRSYTDRAPGGTGNADFLSDFRIAFQELAELTEDTLQDLTVVDCALDCDDGDSCTTDSCELGVCLNRALVCDDGDDCTTDTCQDGVCVNTEIENCCSFDADPRCDDGDSCTTDTCQTIVCITEPCSPGFCAQTEISNCCESADQCEDNDPCTANVCKLNTCDFPLIIGCCEDVADCDDGNSCTSDSCVSSSCVNTDIDGCCFTAGDCNDGDVCTSDSCVTDQCVNTPVANCCNDVNDCDDGNACTSDTCGSDNTCIFTPISPCCGDGACEGGSETCLTCPADCSQSAGSSCGDGTCDAGNGETCETCPADCPGLLSGKQRDRFCCGLDDSLPPSGCGSQCGSCTIDSSSVASCCGDGQCTGSETDVECPSDCTAVECAASETNCQDGVDEDCDGNIDCDDTDCVSAPACSSGDCLAAGERCNTGTCCNGCNKGKCT